MSLNKYVCYKTNETTHQPQKGSMSAQEIQQKQKEDPNSRKTSGKLGLRNHIKTERKLSQLRIQSGKFIASNNLGSQNFQNYFMQTI